MSEYQRAIEALLLVAGRNICVFDEDLRALDFGARHRAERLKDFFLAGRGNRLRIVLHDTEYVERFCPRAMSLLAQFGHCMEIRRTAPDLRHLRQCYMLTDDDSGIIRFHAEHARGKIFLRLPEESRGIREQFEELWELAEPGLSATKLGL